MGRSETSAVFAAAPRALNEVKLKTRTRIDERNALRDNTRDHFDEWANQKKYY